MKRPIVLLCCLSLLKLRLVAAVEAPDPQREFPLLMGVFPMHGLKYAAAGAQLDGGPRLATSLRLSLAFAGAGLIRGELEREWGFSENDFHRPPSSRSEFFLAPVTADWYGRLVPGLQFELDF